MKVFKKLSVLCNIRKTGLADDFPKLHLGCFLPNTRGRAIRTALSFSVSGDGGRPRARPGIFTGN